MEDLALHSVKLGASGVDIASRSGDDITRERTSWPMDRVHVHVNKTITGVTNDQRNLPIEDQVG